MSKKGNVSWVKPAEPSFLKKFKNDVNFKEGPTVETKKQKMPQCDEDDDDDGNDREDEMPQVVVLKKGDLSAEEVTKIKSNEKPSETDDQPPADGKIVFKKPVKRSSEKFEGITASSCKKKKKSDDPEKKESSAVKVKNNSLLSFGDDDDDED